ncbi:MAG: hypothetical protein ACR2PL_26335, partial [Dehalococcoidia bacterium]
MRDTRLKPDYFTRCIADVPVDCVFEDQIGARVWQLDFNQHEASPLAYSDGWLAHTQFYANQCLMTEDGWDRLGATNDPLGNPWLYLVAAEQHAVGPHFAGVPLSSYRYLAPNVTQSIFGDLTVTANWNALETYAVNVPGAVNSQVAPGGFLAITAGATVVAGDFVGFSNNSQLSAGEHYLVVERSQQLVHVRQPVGADTVLSVDAPAGIGGGQSVTVTAFDRTGNVLRPVPSYPLGGQIVVTYKQQWSDGSPVDRYDLIAGLPPALSGVRPNAGPPINGGPREISGAHFVSGATVGIGGRAAVDANVIGGGTSITATAPAHGTLGDVNLDGRVNPVDALCILRSLAGLPGTNACPASLTVAAGRGGHQPEQPGRDPQRRLHLPDRRSERLQHDQCSRRALHPAERGPAIFDAGLSS